MLSLLNILYEYQLYIPNMIPMDKEQIIHALESTNSWWYGKFDLEFRDRTIYAKIKRFMPERQIIALTGMRRTAKTMLMFKFVKDYLADIEKTNIIYFSFDDFRDLKLRTVLHEYSRIRNKDLESGKYIFFFDEIQKVDGWDEQLKALYDAYPNIKFIISGSESLFIRKKSKESLAGRMYEFQIKTLSFKEYLGFRNLEYRNNSLSRNTLQMELSKFFVCNGFPEIIGKDADIAEKYLKENVIDRIIYRDIPQILPIKEPAILDQLFKIILSGPGEIININSIANDLGISRQTASLYIDYLERSFLIRKLYNFSKNARKTQRRSKKYYPAIISPGLLGNSELFGKIFETFAVNESDAEFFWRDAYKREVDIVKTNPLIAIEIKSGRIKDTKNLETFIKKFGPSKSIIISYEIEETRGSVNVIPFYKYLLDA